MRQPYTEPVPMSRLRLARLRARISQEELAVRAGLTRGTIYFAEKPSAKPSLRTQRAVAEVLKVDPETLWPTNGVVEPEGTAA